MLSYREYKVEVKDRRFEPMMLLIEQGDSVWFSWESTRDSHCVYQIDPPSLDHPAADEYKPVSYMAGHSQTPANIATGNDYPVGLA